jgi:hypothetical protein
MLTPASCEACTLVIDRQCCCVVNLSCSFRVDGCRYAGHTVALSGVTLIFAYATLLFFPVNFIQVG